MAESEYLTIDADIQLRSPVLLAAFAGWNDAGQAATYALSSLLKLWAPLRCAHIDPEEFFVFTETRPTITLSPSKERTLHWPPNYVFAHRLPEAERDVMLLLGTEPQLKWRTFCRTIVALARRYEASSLITLGGLLADVPHTMEPRLTGFATSPELRARLDALDVGTSSYQGPTGIVGTLYDAWAATKLPSLTLWVNVPHYISASPNPHAALALLRRMASLLDLPLPLESLQEQAEAFSAQINEALQENPEAMEYVRQLEQHFDEESPPGPAPELISELEEFLRRRRPSGDDESE